MKQWFALRVKPRKERVVERQLTSEGYLCYLPLKPSLRQWSDRQKLIYQVLFPSYIFVNIDVRQIYNILDFPYCLRFVYFDKKPAVVEASQLDALRLLLSQQVDLMTQPKSFIKGDRVRFLSGRFAGLEGIIEICNTKKRRFVLRFDTIGMDVVVDMTQADLQQTEIIK